MRHAIPPDLALREESAGDVAFAAALYREGRWGELVATEWPDAAKTAFLDSQFGLQSAHYARAHPGAERWIVERGGATVGRLYLDCTDKAWRLLEVGLLAREQGRGRGSAVIDWVLARARLEGAVVELHVVRENVRAAALYRRMGFYDVESGTASHRRMHWEPSIPLPFRGEGA